MTRALMQQEVAGRSYSSTRSRERTRTIPRIASRSVAGHRARPTRRPIRRYLRLPKTLALVVVAAGLVYALVVHVPELASLTQSPILDTTTETFEEAGMPDFSSTLASLPRREVVFDMTDDLEYLVQEGETLSEIATRFDVSTQFLAEYNSLTNADLLKQGQTIIIPSRRNRE